MQEEEFCEQDRKVKLIWRKINKGTKNYVTIYDINKKDVVSEH